MGKRYTVSVLLGMLVAAVVAVSWAQRAAASSRAVEHTSYRGETLSYTSAIASPRVRPQVVSLPTRVVLVDELGRVIAELVASDPKELMGAVAELADETGVRGTEAIFDR